MDVAAGKDGHATRFRLRVKGDGSGSGVASSRPLGFNCSITKGNAPDSCFVDVDSGTVVVLKSDALSGSIFGAWSGPCTGMTPCQFPITSPVVVTAEFDIRGRPHHTLTVTGAGTGSGSVASSPAGIACTLAAGAATGDCHRNFDDGTLVTLTAKPADGSTFTGWTGACQGPGSCPLALTADAAITAEFAEIPPRLIISRTSLRRENWDHEWWFDSATRTFLPNSDTILVTSSGRPIRGLSGQFLVLDSCFFEGWLGVSGFLADTVTPARIIMNWGTADDGCPASTWPGRFDVESTEPGVLPVSLPITLAVIRSQAPEANTRPATSIGTTSATLRGSTGGQMHTVWFIIGTDSTDVAWGVGRYINVADPFAPAFGNSEWSIPINGLAPDTRYYFQILAYINFEFVSPAILGGVLSFTTPR